MRVRKERCETCLYRLHYDRETRERILGQVEEDDGFVQCHKHHPRAAVICSGYFHSVGEHGGAAVRLALVFQGMGMDVIEWVGEGDYPPPAEDEDLE